MLELSYAAAPKSMKGFITACFLVTNTLGNFLNVLWTPKYGGLADREVAKTGSAAAGPVLRLHRPDRAGRGHRIQSSSAGQFERSRAEDGPGRRGDVEP